MWDQEFRTLAFFHTAISLRSLLAEEVSPTSNQQTHRNAPPLRSFEESGLRSGHARSVPPRTDGDVFEANGGGGSICCGVGVCGHSDVTSGASSVVLTPVDDAVSSGIASTAGQEAFLVSLRRPIIWAKPSAFDRGMFNM